MVMVRCLEVERLECAMGEGGGALCLGMFRLSPLPVPSVIGGWLRVYAFEVVEADVARWQQRQRLCGGMDEGGDDDGE
jgi:hypothetical protein